MKKEIENLFKDLHNDDIQLVLNKEENIEIISFKNKISSDVLKKIKDNKNEIINFLKNKKECGDSAISLVEKSDSYLASSGQRGIWFASQIKEGSIAHNMPLQKVLNGISDRKLFIQAINCVIDRHEILRTIFKLDDHGILKQIVLDRSELAFKVQIEDLRNNSNYEKMISEAIHLDSNQAFDLENGPLLRISLFQISDETYVFYFNIHHIICDGWSMEILEKEITLYYEALITGNRPSLDEIKIQYKDFATWESKIILDGSLQKHKEYWLSKLSGKLPVLDLLSFKKRPRFKTFNGYSLETNISSDVLVNLRKMAQSEKSSFFIAVLAVVKVLINKYTNEKDIVIGFPISGRQEKVLHNQIGYYAKTLVLRSQIDENDTFLSFFKQLKENTLSAYEYQDYPFDLLVSDLNLQKDLSRNSLYDISVTYNNIASKNETFREEKSDEIKNLGTKRCKCDFEFHFTEVGDDLNLVLNFNNDIYESESVIKFLQHFRQILAEVSLHENKQIKNINYLTEAEKTQLLNGFSDVAANYPKDKTIVDLFEEQAEKTPDNIAVVFQDKTLSYRALNNQANQLGLYLKKEYNIVPDDLIGIKLDRSEQMIVVILGILKSGAAYVPIDINYPEERISYIEKDSKCKVVIGQEELAKFSAKQQELSTANLEKYIEPHHLAYVIYTSGTTGNPKGTLLEHRNVVRLFFTDKPLFDFNENDIWTMFHSYSFDFSVWEMYGALLYGGKLIVVPKEVAQNTPEFLELLYDQSVTILNQTPSAFYNLIDCEKSIKKRDFKLRNIIFGGEALNPFLLFNWHKKYPTAKLINMYGITETTVHVTYKEIGEKEINFEQSNIGKTIPTLSCYILDASKQLVPEGVFGELYVVGAGLARGYLNRPELTLEKFTNNPFIAGERMYKSGDIGRWISGGDIEYKGRQDDQVKIRGHRIELGEIEKALSLEKTIRQSVVIVDKDKNIVAYYISDIVLDKKVLQQNLSALLPDYMLPGYYVQVEEIPLTTNGKVDRSSLPAIQLKDLIKEEYVAPRTKEEKLLVSICSDVLKHDMISIKDSFYNLGGDSIKSIQIITQLKSAGFYLKITDLLHHPVLEDLAKMIKSDVSTIENTGDNTLQNAVAGEIKINQQSELSFNQRVYTKLDFSQVVLKFKVSEFQENNFENEFRDLISRFPSLCMRYELEDNKLVQRFILAKDQKIKFTILNNNDEDEISKQIVSNYNKAYDILNEELIRVNLLVDANTGTAEVYLCIHHSLLDDYSTKIVHKELTDYFENHINLPGVAYVHYFKFIEWQKNFLASADGRREKEYWTNTLNTGFLYDHASSIEKNNHPVSQKIRITGARFDEITALSKKMNLPVNALCNGLYQFLLTKAAIEFKDLFTILVTCREAVIPGINLELLPGVINNGLPVPYKKLKGHYDFNQDYIFSAYENYLEARLHQLTPYEIIREEVQHNLQKDIDQNVVGSYNFLLDENYVKETGTNEVKVTAEHYKTLSNTVSMKAILFKNALEIEILCSNDIYEKKKNEISLDSGLKALLELVTEKIAIY
ncbi:non-ribosomal peptide synthetase [Flavobacterium aquidurense]|uniref:Nonribosomal peptide synthetase n=1 Tax=Flavobacterium aquidurense TaxID=362413 RepID=A0A0N8VN77_9FLAO|nr:non-ribosomal peptide synthetase [Flavobacterium aquidurense]KQB41356.1 Nonribosomal peptide synthetase [Flavobacterium aquidurense]